MGSLYASNSVHADYGAARWVVIVTIYLFAAAYSMTWALGIKIFASEIQPLATRATVTSLAQSGNCVCIHCGTSYTALFNAISGSWLTDIRLPISSLP